MADQESFFFTCFPFPFSDHWMCLGRY